jgi:Domain of unknown function (DUF6265)
MTRLSAALLLLAEAPVFAQAPVPATMPGWLAGAWAMESADRWADEFWTPPRGGMMIGAARIGKGSDLREWEHTRIVRKPDGSISYFAQPKGRPAIEFPMLSRSASAIEFANPAHDYPQRIRYERDGAVLRAEISKLDGSSPMRWEYRAMGAPR